jgi:hypothetical protein
LIESYIPKLDEETAAALSARLRSTVAQLRRDGLPLRWRRSFALVDEETYVWMIDAPDVEGVARVHRQAGLAYDHVVEAVAMEPG